MSVVMCPKHNRPVPPSKTKQGAIWCYICQVEANAKSRNKRMRRWQTEFISCTRHPERRCKLSLYLNNGGRRCTFCCHRLASGMLAPNVQQYSKVRALKTSLKNRAKFGCHSLSLQGFKLFERMTGANYATQI